MVPNDSTNSPLTFSQNPWAAELWTVDQSVLLPSLPLITIGILNYNRREELRRTLDSVTRAVQYPNKEIIVVDNASTDGSKEMIATEFPDVIVIALQENILTAARNYFYRSAKGKYIFSYDDDSFCATPASMYYVVRFFELRQEIDSITFLCYQPITAFVESYGAGSGVYDGKDEYRDEGLHYVEGGMCIRSEAFKKIQGYDLEYQWGAEGADLALQLYKRGSKMIYYPSIATLHMKSSTNRNTQKQSELFTRNSIWTLAKHFPLLISIPMTIAYSLRRLIAMVLHPDVASGYLKGLIFGIGGFFRQRRKCEKLSLRQSTHLIRWLTLLLRW